MRQTAFLVFCLLSLAGCATVGGQIRMIGTEADFIDKAGFAEEVSVNWLTSTVYRTDRPAEFSKDTKQVVWFMVFRNGAFIGNVDFTAKWYSPDGLLYEERKFTQVPGNWNIAVTSLPMAGEKASSLPGKWRLEIFKDNQLIAYRSFRLN